MKGLHTELPPDDNGEATVQTSALPPYQAYCPVEKIKHLFQHANEHYVLTMQGQCSALTHAERTGKYLNEVHAVVAAAHGCWSGHLKNHFKGERRNAYNYMEISRCWKEIEPMRQKNPNLSIDAALRFLRTGKTGPKKFDKMKFEADKVFAKILRDVKKEWSDAEKERLQLNPGAYREAMNQLKQNLRRQHEGLSKDDICTELEHARARLRLRLAAQRELMSEFNPRWLNSDELCPAVMGKRV